MSIIHAVTGLEHSYSKLLAITVLILGAGFACFALGLKPKR